ncbi:hypothetical protein [Neobacillus drentensis]|uniref:hypothetical protein n=1 Tax=Neobacillus drentensis TaxID=220684 RepID=UPI0030008D42
MNRFEGWIYTIRLLLRGSRVLKINGRYIVIDFFDYGDGYMAAATSRSCSVWNCYGSTKEQAQEMALFKLKKAMEQELVVNGVG